MKPAPFPVCSNDNPPPANAVRPTHRMVPLIGAVHDDGRVERYAVVQLLRVPVEDLRRGRPQP
jgi:hypothetical protein